MNSINGSANLEFTINLPIKEDVNVSLLRLYRKPTTVEGPPVSIRR
jgi:hypothetical protein